MPVVSVDEFLASKLDYLVVGGGTSGLVVAARLTENPDCVVGVIEAGEYHETDPTVNLPGMAGHNIFNPKYDWRFTTVPQKYVNDRKVFQSRGKGLGGSSLLNILAFVRPSKDELDSFEELGNPGWNWKSLLEYMKRSERLEAPVLSPVEAKLLAVSPDSSLHGTDGPITKSFPMTHLTEVHAKTLDSLESFGVQRNLDNSGGNTVGSILCPTCVDTKTATRSYSASAFYAPNAQRPNFLVLTEAYATKIHLKEVDGGLKCATGVDIIKDGSTFTIHAAKEVILSAGSLQTPQLLELSGIGDRRILDATGIDTVIDLPGVGENLQDHANVPTIVEVDKNVESLEILNDPVQLKKHQDLYNQQKGIFASSPGSLLAFLPAKAFGNESDVQRWVSQASMAITPEIFASTHPTVKRGIEKQYDIMRRWIDNPEHSMGQLLYMNGHFPIPGLTSDPNKRYMTLLCAYTHPISRGTVHIASKDPTEPPSIQQNYLSNPTDLDVLAKLVSFTMRLYKTKPISGLVIGPATPKLDDDQLNDEDTLHSYVRDTLGTVHHPVGSASMLPLEDGGVVDSNLLVYGTTNLRVVDCSIIPLEISSNIQTLAYAIGEKAADIIKGL
ncbi:alcohol oxidase [Gautieria morchelliformis]|nr:alcohol oxidase [Gautieria morchelliformis]